MSLPSGYTRLEYIECTGTQYIDTGVISVSSAALQIIMEIEWLSGTGFIFSTTANARALHMYVKSDTNIECAYMGDYENIALTTVYGKYRISKSSYTFTANGTSTSFPSSGSSTSTNLHLLSRDSKTLFAQSARIYSCTVINTTSDTLLRQFIPCKNASGVVGLWDDVNSVFYGNSGTGSFIAGTEIKLSAPGRTFINGTGYDIKKGRTIIGGTGYGIKKGRTLIGGTGYDISLGTPVSELDVGTSVYMDVDGESTEFIVVHQGNPDTAMYDTSCNGTWVMSKDCLMGSTAFNNTSSATYKDSVVDVFLQNLEDLLETNIQAKIKTVKIPYADSYTYTSGKWTAKTGTEGMTTRIFMPTPFEIGGTYYAPEIGACLDYFALAATDKRKAMYNGNYVVQWTRNPCKDYPNKVCITDEDGATALKNGKSISYGASGTAYVRPMFILDSEEALFDSDYNIM